MTKVFTSEEASENFQLSVLTETKQGKLNKKLVKKISNLQNQL